MSQLKFHNRRLAQICFVVPDIERAMEDHGRELNIGAWFCFKNFKFDTLLYRGAPCEAVTNVAICFSGEFMYELIQQVNDAPSVYLDVINKEGYGFHHYGFMVDDLDAEIARYEAQGYARGQYSEVNGIRAMYMDARPVVPGFVEMLEISDGATATFQPIYDAANAWDGKTHQVTRYG